MNKYVKLLLAIFVFVVAIFGVQKLYESLSNDYKDDQNLVVESDKTDTSVETDKETEVKLVDFSVVDGEGEEVSFSSLTGKPMIVNFWASWCSPCKNELPDFQEAFDKYGENITFLMVNLTDGSRETVTKAKDFISSKGYTFPVYYDVMQEAAISYSIYSIPTTYFFDSEGKAVARADGMIDLDTLEKGIEMIEEK